MSLLAPFEELTKEISSSTATAADVIPAITALRRLLKKGADRSWSGHCKNHTAGGGIEVVQQH